MKNSGLRRRRGWTPSGTLAVEKADLEIPDAEEVAAAALPSNGLAVQAEAPVVPRPAALDASPHLVQAVLELVGRMNQFEQRMASLEQAAANLMAQGNVARETLERHTRNSALTQANETMKNLGAEEVVVKDDDGKDVVDPEATFTKYVMAVKAVAMEWEELLTR